jgi:hypothetical protein
LYERLYEQLCEWLCEWFAQTTQLLPNQSFSRSYLHEPKMTIDQSYAHNRHLVGLLLRFEQNCLRPVLRQRYRRLALQSSNALPLERPGRSRLHEQRG